MDFERSGNVVYGSVTEETKQALIYLHQLYVEGILDSNFLLRQQKIWIHFLRRKVWGYFRILVGTEQSTEFIL